MHCYFFIFSKLKRIFFSRKVIAIFHPPADIIVVTFGVFLLFREWYLNVKIKNTQESIRKIMENPA
jgi:hypothetical protein